jgi:outer membrane protein OmpA-like peptidoglycan-associated protein
MANQAWHDINEPSIALSKKTAAQPKQSEPEDSAPQRQKENAEIKLLRSKWLPGDKGFEFNEACKLQVEAQFLDPGTVRKKLTGDLFVTFNGEEEDLLYECKGDLNSEGVALIEVKLFFGKEYHAARAQDPSASCTYYLKNISNSVCEKPLDSVGLEMPSEKITADFVEVPDVHFNHESPLACLDKAGGLIESLATALKFAADNTGKEVVIFGHTDTSGDPAYNYDLSKWRAQAVKALLDNDKQTWGDLAAPQATVENIQTFLTALTKRYGWQCNPGPIDGKEGPKTNSGREAFQRQFNEKHGGCLTVDGIFGEQSWGAMFTVVSKLLEQRFGQLANGSQMPKLTYASKCNGIYPCGESFPIDQAEKDNYRSRQNRRVEIVFFDKGKCPELLEPPKKTEPVKKKECPVYDTARVGKKVIPAATNDQSITLKIKMPHLANLPDDVFKLCDSSGKCLGQAPLSDAEKSATDEYELLIPGIPKDATKLTLKITDTKDRDVGIDKMEILL